MTATNSEYCDPTTQPFWDGAAKRQLLIQKCVSCKHCQFYPRPMCLECGSSSLDWIVSTGNATLYSVTTIRTQVIPDITPPYLVGLVDLDEGPRLVAGISGLSAKIGSRLRLDWRERKGLPPVPVFHPVNEA